MKKIVFYAIAAVVMTACAISEIVDITPEMDDARKITITATSDNGTRLTVQDDWSLFWGEEDAMLAWDGKTGSKFTLTEGAGTTSGSFEGEPQFSPFYLFYPYSLISYTEIGFDALYLDITTQNEGLKSTYMCSAKMLDPSDENPSVLMKQMGAAVVLNMTFPDGAYNGAIIQIVELTGLNSKGTFDAANNSFSNLSASDITINDGETTVAENEATIKFNIFPTEIAAGGTIGVTVYVKKSDESVVVLTQTLTVAGGVNLERAKFHTINCKALTEPIELKMASYNVRNGTGMDSVTDLDRTAQAINDIDAQILSIQELDSVTVRSQQQYVLKELAQKTGMYYTFASAIEFSGGSYGVGVLSKEEPIKTYKVALPGTEEKRVLLVCEFDDYVFLATHFSLTENDAMESVGIIEQEASKWDKPLFLAGDLNIKPDSEVFKELTKEFEVLSDTTKATYPADEPTVCIDYIFKRIGDQMVLKNSEVINEPIASDHRPIAVEVEM